MANWLEERKKALAAELAEARAISNKEPLDRARFRERYDRELNWSGTPLVETELDSLELQSIYRSPARTLEEFVQDLKYLAANDLG